MGGQPRDAFRVLTNRTFATSTAFLVVYGSRPFHDHFALPMHRDMWRYIADLLNEAAADNSYVHHKEAEAQFMCSLKTEGLL
jgi:hypothetical protein